MNRPDPLDTMIEMLERLITIRDNDPSMQVKVPITLTIAQWAKVIGSLDALILLVPNSAQDCGAARDEISLQLEYAVDGPPEETPQ